MKQNRSDECYKQAEELSKLIEIGIIKWADGALEELLPMCEKSEKIQLIEIIKITYLIGIKNAFEIIDTAPYGKFPKIKE